MSNDGVILLDPYPRKIDVIFTKEDKKRLESLGKVLWYEGDRASDKYIEEHLPNTVALIGQTSMPRERLDRAPLLRMIANVEGNFLPNIDYGECYRRNIPVLSCSPAFASAVAEMSLGLAIAAGRGIIEGHNAFGKCQEVYGGPSNLENFQLSGRTKGIIGCGSVGKKLIPLLKPFGGEILAYDPWIHDHCLEGLGVTPVALEELFKRSQYVFVISAPTTENQKDITKKQLQMMPKNSVLILTGRAAVVEFEDLLEVAASGHIRVATDVFPEEPVPEDHPVRNTPNLILSAHRAGGLPEVYFNIGRMVVDDLEMILRGLPPQQMQRPPLETITRYRGMPIR